MNFSAILSTMHLLEGDARFLWPDVRDALPDHYGPHEIRAAEYLFLLGFAAGARCSLSAIQASAPVVGDLITQAQLRADILGTVERKACRHGEGPDAAAFRYRQNAARAQALLTQRVVEEQKARKRRAKGKRGKARKVRP